MFLYEVWAVKANVSAMWSYLYIGCGAVVRAGGGGHIIYIFSRYLAVCLISFITGTELSV